MDGREHIYETENAQHGELIWTKIATFSHHLLTGHIHDFPLVSNVLTQIIMTCRDHLYRLLQFACECDTELRHEAIKHFNRREIRPNALCQKFSLKKERRRKNQYDSNVDHTHHTIESYKLSRKRQKINNKKSVIFVPSFGFRKKYFACVLLIDFLFITNNNCVYTHTIINYKKIMETSAVNLQSLTHIETQITSLALSFALSLSLHYVFADWRGLWLRLSGRTWFSFIATPRWDSKSCNKWYFVVEISVMMSMLFVAFSSSHSHRHRIKNNQSRLSPLNHTVRI